MRTAPRWQRGIAAVELAIIMGATIFLIPTVFLFGRVFLQYNVLKQATQDAANYMASIPRADLRSVDKVEEASERAEQMVTMAVAEAGITPASTLARVWVYCNDVDVCGPGRPASITVTTSLTIDSADFNLATFPWIDEYFQWKIPARSTVAYSN